MKVSRRCPWAVAVAVLLATPSCDGGSKDGADAVADPVEETADDDPLGDVLDDTVEEPEPDPEEDPGCVYPEGPYTFNAIGATAGPALWPDSVKGTNEISELEHADFEAFFCDPGVQSIAIFFATTS